MKTDNVRVYRHVRDYPNLLNTLVLLCKIYSKITDSGLDFSTTKIQCTKMPYRIHELFL